MLLSNICLLLLIFADIKGVDEEGNEVTRKSSDDEPFAALAFKIMADPFVGKLAFFRVYSGTLNSGSYVLTLQRIKREHVGRILQMHANREKTWREYIQEILLQLLDLRFTATGDTLCDENTSCCTRIHGIPRAGY